MASGPFIVVFETTKQVVAFLYRQYLEEAGIETLLNSGTDTGVPSIIFGSAFMRYQLLVHEEDVEQAAELIAALEAQQETTEE